LIRFKLPYGDQFSDIPTKTSTQSFVECKYNVNFSTVNCTSFYLHMMLRFNGL